MLRRRLFFESVGLTAVAVSTFPCPDVLRILVSFLIQLCGDTGASDIENCAQGGPPSLPLNVTVVNYSVVVEKEMTARRKVLTYTGNPPEEIKLLSSCARSFFFF